jgi:hypothetical protein
MSDQDLVLDTIQEAQRLPLNDCIRSTLESRRDHYHASISARPAPCHGRHQSVAIEIRPARGKVKEPAGYQEQNTQIQVFLHEYGLELSD